MKYTGEPEIWRAATPENKLKILLSFIYSSALSFADSQRVCVSILFYGSVIYDRPYVYVYNI